MLAESVGGLAVGEAVNADLLLHVVDVSSDEVFKQIESVEKVLKEIGCEKKEKLVLLNKADVTSSLETVESLRTIYPGSVCISAKTGMNLDEMAKKVLEKYRGGEVTVEIDSSAADGKMLGFLKSSARIIKEDYYDSRVSIKAKLGKSQLPALKHLQPENLVVVDS